MARTLRQFFEYLTNPVFDSILSIGYEYEAHYLSKLVHSELDEKYYSASKHTRLANESNLDTTMRENQTYYIYPNYIEYMCDNKKDGQGLKYMDVCISTDNTADRHPPISRACHKYPMTQKNKYWSIKKTNKETRLYAGKKPIVFEDRECAYFPDVEWIVTFYKLPAKQKVLKSMHKSLQLIINSLHSMKNEKVILYANNKVVLKTRLFSDMLLVLNNDKAFKVVPQLTFTCHITDCAAVINGFFLKGTMGYAEIQHITRLTANMKLNDAQRNYLFLVMYMMRMFSKFKESKADFYKYNMTFLPRHEFKVLVEQMCSAGDVSVLLGAIHGAEADITKTFGLKYVTALYKIIKTKSDILNIDDDHRYSTLFEANDDIVYIEFRGLAQLIKHYLNGTTRDIDMETLYNKLKTMLATHTRRAQAGR